MPRTKSTEPKKKKPFPKTSRFHYNPEVEGYGSPEEWRETFFEKMSLEDAEKIFTQFKDDSPWGVLGIRKGATQDEIKKAFRKLIMQWHPDKNPDNVKQAEAMTKKIIAAYTILTGGK
jgi:hypothetical protein